MDYQSHVRMLGSRNTHLKLRERARLSLLDMAREGILLPPDFFKKVQMAIYRRENAIRYHLHFPGWQDNIPEEIREQMLANYPLGGYGMADMNTMLYLERTARESEEECKVAPPPEPQESAIDRMVEDYFAYRKTIKQETL